MRRFNPWEEMLKFQEELDKMLGRYMMPIYCEKLSENNEGNELIPYSEPPTDLIDKGKEYMIMLDLPGVDKDDIKIEVKENNVEIKAEKTSEKSKEEKGFYMQERGYMGYARSIRLPEKVIPGKTQADYNNGVLEIVLKKSRPQKDSFRVDIN